MANGTPKSDTSIERKVYDKKFFQGQKGAKNLPQILLDKLFEIIHPKRVIDIGCGVGIWLSVFEENYGCDIIGIDGDYLDKNDLLIDKSKFIPTDLKIPFTDNPSVSEYITQPKQFDLAVSLEVAEHLPEERAKSFVHDLTSLSDIVLFSAAIPYQGGTNHINEQPTSYWIDLFEKENYMPINCIRPLFKQGGELASKENLLWCYANNGILYVNKSLSASFEKYNQIDDYSILPTTEKIATANYLHDKYGIECIDLESHSKTFKKIYKTLKQTHAAYIQIKQKILSR